MPTSDQEFDAQRIKLLLDDLEKRTRHEASYAQLEVQTLPRARVTGTATRAGLLRLGVDIARAAHAEDCDTVCIRHDGLLINEDRASVINILLADDSTFEKPQPKALSTYIGCGLSIALLVATIALAIVGLVTVCGWLAG